MRLHAIVLLILFVQTTVVGQSDSCSQASLLTTLQLNCISSGETITGNTSTAIPVVYDFSCLSTNSDTLSGLWFSFIVEGSDLVIESSGGKHPLVVILDRCNGTEFLCSSTPVDEIIGNNLFSPTQYGDTLRMWVGFEDDVDSFALCLSIYTPPTNDQCAQAIDITQSLQCPDGNSVKGSTEHATHFFNYNLPNSPDCFDPHQDDVVWYRFTAPGVDWEISDNKGNNPSFAILEDNNCQNGATFILCDQMPYSFNNGDPDNLFHKGKEYILMIGFSGGALATDSFDLCINVPEPPLNDLCHDAIQIDSLLSCTTQSNLLTGHTGNASNYGLSLEGVDYDFTCFLDTNQADGVWYKFVALGMDLIIDDELGTQPNILLFSQMECSDSAHLLMCEQAPISNNFGSVGNNIVEMGETYYMYITFGAGETSADSFALCLLNTDTLERITAAASYCQMAPLCGLDSLHNRVLDMMDQNLPPVPFPGCPADLEQPHWIPFLATDTFSAFTVQVSQCMNGIGIQFGIFELPTELVYGENQPFCHPHDLGSGITQCVHAVTPIEEGSTVTIDFNTEVGQLYGILIDGWAGALCSVEFNVISGGGALLFSDSLSQPGWNQQIDTLGIDSLCLTTDSIWFSIESSVTGATSYTWFIVGDSNSIHKSDTATQFVFNSSGEYRICYQAESPCDVSDSFCTTVHVTECLSSTNQILVDDSDLLLYPNPASSNISLTGNVPLRSLCVYDIHGKEVLSKEYSNHMNSQSLNISHLPEGVFVLQSTWDGGGTKFSKFVVSRY